MNRICQNTAIIITWLFFLSQTVAAQTGGRIGTIDEIDQESGYITVSGTRYAYRDSEVSITYNGKTYPTTVLAPGVRIQYRLSDAGSMQLITLVGPQTFLSTLDSH